MAMCRGSEVTAVGGARARLLGCQGSIQVFLGPVRTEREAEAAAHPHDLHERAAEGARARVRGDTLPGYLHPRGARAQDRPHRGQSSGLVPEQKGQISQARTRGQLQSRDVWKQQQ